MNKNLDATAIKIIPVDQITVLNPRSRNKKVFLQIVDSISKVGLKRPITVNQSKEMNGEPAYELVCGQGRLEALISLGQREIPAIVIDVTEEDRLIMGLVENLARRQHNSIELLRDIGDLKKRGYSDKDIAKKTGLSNDYVHSIRRLLEQGEERLLVAVESGNIPIKVAIDISKSDAKGAQDALAQAYEKGLLRGKKLLAAKRLIERRQLQGKAYGRRPSNKGRSRISSGDVVGAYQKEADRQRLMIKRAEITQNRLLFVIEAMRSLMADENFLTLLRAESLETMPRPLADLIVVREAL